MRKNNVDALLAWIEKIGSLKIIIIIIISAMI